MPVTANGTHIGDLRELLERFPLAQQVGPTEWADDCPICGSTISLEILARPGGKGSLHCRNGCAAADVLAAGSRPAQFARSRPAAEADVDEAAQPEQARYRPNVVRLADVEPKRVGWLWRGYVPLGKLTIVDGDPGLGKSQLALDLAARVSTGREMPDGSASDLEGSAGVVLLCAEDDAADTIRPRLDAAGGECTRIVLLESIAERVDTGRGELTVTRLPTLQDVQAIREAVDQIGAKLVVVDPIMAFTVGDTHVDAEVRRLLAALARLAAELGIAVLALRHLNKSGMGKAIYRGSGSIAFTAAARSALIVGRDPDDQAGERLVLAPVKGNLHRPMPSLAYHVGAKFHQVIQDEVPYIVWDGASGHRADALMAMPGEAATGGALAEAKEFLADFLAEGAIEAKTVLRQADQAGIASKTLQRAKEALGVVSRRQGLLASEGHWVWALPDSEQAAEPNMVNDPLRCPRKSVTTLGESDHVRLDRSADMDRCAVCGADVERFTMDGQPLCERHWQERAAREVGE